MRNKNARLLALSAALCAIALTVFVLEGMLPMPVPIPGVKPGLANIVTVFALAALGWKPTLAILLVRILLGNLLMGQGVALLYSMAGGLTSYLAMVMVFKLLRRDQLWVCGVIGGLVHNLGQIGVAVILTGSAAVLLYLPVLLLSGIVTGVLTGLSAQLIRNKLSKIGGTKQ